MDERTARDLLRAERARIEQTLADAEASHRMDEIDEQVVGDDADAGQRLTNTAVDDAFVAGLGERLAALDRAERRLDEGTYGRSVLSGEPLPDERLQADPAAELTVEEAEMDPPVGGGGPQAG